MKFKRLLIIAALLCLVSLSAVSAADDAMDDVANIMESTDEVAQDSDLLGVQNANPNDFTNLNYTINANNDPVVYLDGNYAFNPENDSELSKGIKITRPVTIQGNGAVIDANTSECSFHIASPTVVLRNISFINANFYTIFSEANDLHIINCSFANCSSGNPGSALSTSGSCYLEGCTFNNCSADGGALFMNGGGSITGCSFTDCIGEGNGGAIYINRGAATTVKNCSFTNCQAEKGGAIYNYYENVTVRDCNFFNCSANRAGAIFWLGTDSAILTGMEFEPRGHIQNCSFRQCRADKNNNTCYGAVYVNGMKVVMSECDFIDCNTTGNTAALEWSSTYGILTNCNFINCSSQNFGALTIGSVVLNRINNCNFINCSAENYAGAMTMKYAERSFITDLTFSNCHARGCGAAYLMGYNNVLANCTFKDCYGNSTGALSASGDNAVITNCSFTNCYATTNNGGAVLLAGNNGVLANCSFKDCYSSSYNAGAVMVSYMYAAQSSTPAKSTISNCRFTDCFAQKNAGAIFVNSQIVSVNDCIFTDCSSGDDGGSLYLTYCTQSVLDNCSFHLSKAANGGAIALLEGDSNILKCSFEGCGGDLGGAIYSVDHISTAYSCNFNRNHARVGGATYDINATESAFTNNRADECGGAMFGGIAVNCTFDNNTAGISGNDTQNTTVYSAPNNTADNQNTNVSKDTTPTETPSVVQKPADEVKLTLKSATVKKSAKKLVIRATLKINGKAKKGLKVTFKFNGKKYSAKTDKNGVAKITVKKSVLKKLKVGKKVKYQATYSKVSVTKTTKVKK